MKSSICHSLLATVACLGLLVPSTRAALSITADKITTTEGSSTYGYTLTYDDMLAAITAAGHIPTTSTTTTATSTLSTGGKFFDDIFDKSANIRLSAESKSSAWNNVFIYASGGTTQSYFTYKFDFTAAGYQIESFTVKDALYTVNQTRSVTTQYSTDGITWTDTDGALTNVLRTSTSITSGITSGISPSITLSSGISTLYYRVVFTSLPPGTATFNAQQSWNRSNGTAGQNANLFAINFNLTSIPEPASIAPLIAAAALGFVCWTRCHRRSL
ncbi:hypothetical protein [Geminisphaera colitermitum]|uniref:hypothetical protein n=1 Tax=Geminisphaera colitermitum TaxID=1148786 RepID=UPI0001965336|nr:hypothetical protein [Geminisphaera colitermitum]